MLSKNAATNSFSKQTPLTQKFNIELQLEIACHLPDLCNAQLLRVQIPKG